jgi:hypothetical protein
MKYLVSMLDPSIQGKQKASKSPVLPGFLQQHHIAAPKFKMSFHAATEPPPDYLLGRHVSMGDPIR